MYQPFPLRQNVIQLLLELDDGVQFEFELDIVVYRVCLYCQMWIRWKGMVSGGDSVLLE